MVMLQSIRGTWPHAEIPCPDLAGYRGSLVAFTRNFTIVNIPGQINTYVCGKTFRIHEENLPDSCRNVKIAAKYGAKSGYIT